MSASNIHQQPAMVPPPTRRGPSVGFLDTRPDDSPLPPLSNEISFITLPGPPPSTAPAGNNCNRGRRMSRIPPNETTITTITVNHRHRKMIRPNFTKEDLMRTAYTVGLLELLLPKRATTTSSSSKNNNSKNKKEGPPGKSQGERGHGPVVEWDDNMHIIGPVTSSPLPMARLELADNRQCTSANTLALTLLSRVPRAVSRQEFESALDLVDKAHENFQMADNQDLIVDSEALYSEVRGDQVKLELQQARDNKDYERCVSIAERVWYHYKLMASLTVIRRETPEFEVTGRKERIARYQQYDHPFKVVQEYAVEDGDSAMTRAQHLLEKKDFEGSRRSLEEAVHCFEWAGLRSQLKVLKKLRRRVDVTELATEGERILRTVCLELNPVSRKDFEFLDQRLARAEDLFNKAHEQNGMQTVQLVRKCLGYVKDADMAWLQCADSFQARDYDRATHFLSQAQHHLSAVAKGLKLVNSAMDRMISLVVYGNQYSDNLVHSHDEVVNPHYHHSHTMKDVTALDIAMEMALIDGRNLLDKASVATDEGLLSDAESFIDASDKCFKWVIESAKRDTPKEVGQVSAVEDNDKATAHLKDFKSINQGMQLLEDYSNIVCQMKKNRRKDPTKGAQTSSQALHGVRQRVEKRRAMLRAKTLMKDATVKIQITHPSTNLPPLTCLSKEDSLESLEDEVSPVATAVRVDSTEVLKTLEEAVALYTKWGCDDLSNEAISVISRLEGDQYYTKVLEAVDGGSFDEALKQLTLASASYGRAVDCKARIQDLEHLRLCIEGDQLMKIAGACLEQKEYDHAVSKLEEAKKKFELAQRTDRLGGNFHARNCRELVASHALADARKAEKDSLMAVLDKDVESAKAHAALAKRCLQWAGLLDMSREIVDSAIKLSERFKEGQEAEVEVNNALEANDRALAIDKILVAKKAFTACQDIYQGLMKAATSLIGQQKTDDSQDVFEYQDMVNRLARVWFDGTKLDCIQHLYACVLADISLDDMDNLMRNGLFQDIVNLLESARGTYQRAGDQQRLSKVEQITEMMGFLRDYLESLDSKDYDLALEVLRRTRGLLQTMEELPPCTIRMPSVKELGEGSEESVILRKAKADGMRWVEEAATMMEKNQFEEATTRIKDARKSYAWLTKMEEGDSLKEMNSRIVILEHEIHKRESFMAGSQLLSQGRGELERSQHEEAIQLLKASLSHFKTAEDAAKVKEVEVAIADSEGQRILAIYEECAVEQRLEECLDALEKGEAYFVQSGNQEKLRVVTKQRAKVQGDLKMRGFQPACDSLDYDLALNVLTAAAECYKQAGDNTFQREEPRAKVKAIALKEGEKLKTDAVSALTKKRSVDMARKLLAEADHAYAWAGMTALSSGVKAVEKDIQVFETRYNADTTFEDAVRLAVAGKTQEAQARAEEALTLYRAAKCVQQISDAQIMSTCLKAEQDLELLTGALKARNVRKSVELVGDAHQIFSAASMLTSKVLEKWLQQVESKLSVLAKLLTFCKTWVTIDDMMTSSAYSSDDGSDINAILGRLSTAAHEVAAMSQTYVVVSGDVLQAVVDSYDDQAIITHKHKCSEKGRSSLDASTIPASVAVEVNPPKAVERTSSSSPSSSVESKKAEGSQTSAYASQGFDSDSSQEIQPSITPATIALVPTEEKKMAAHGHTLSPASSVAYSEAYEVDLHDNTNPAGEGQALQDEELAEPRPDSPATSVAYSDAYELDLSPDVGEEPPLISGPPNRIKSQSQDSPRLEDIPHQQQPPPSELMPAASSEYQMVDENPTAINVETDNTFPSELAESATDAVGVAMYKEAAATEPSQSVEDDGFNKPSPAQFDQQPVLPNDVGDSELDTAAPSHSTYDADKGNDEQQSPYEASATSGGAAVEEGQYDSSYYASEQPAAGESHDQSSAYYQYHQQQQHGSYAENTGAYSQEDIAYGHYDGSEGQTSYENAGSGYEGEYHPVAADEATGTYQGYYDGQEQEAGAGGVLQEYSSYESSGAENEYMSSGYDGVTWGEEAQAPNNNNNMGAISEVSEDIYHLPPEETSYTPPPAGDGDAYEVSYDDGSAFTQPQEGAGKQEAEEDVNFDYSIDSDSNGGSSAPR